MIEKLIIPLDYIILAIGCLIVFFCFWRGVTASILGLLTWLGSIIITIYFYTDLSDFFYSQLLNINIFKNYEQITSIFATLISIPLDIMTITIAAITIGIAVDNTIHYLYRFKEFNKNNNVIEAINLTNMSAGLAVFTTSITIALGFSILSLSNFIPTVIFGIFTSMAMIFAMIGVLILLPSLIMLFKKC